MEHRRRGQQRAPELHWRGEWHLVHRRKRLWPRHRNLHGSHDGHDARDSEHARSGPLLIRRGSGCVARSGPQPSMLIRSAIPCRRRQRGSRAAPRRTSRENAGGWVAASKTQRPPRRGKTGREGTVTGDDYMPIPSRQRTTDRRLQIQARSLRRRAAVRGAERALPQAQAAPGAEDWRHRSCLRWNYLVVVYDIYTRQQSHLYSKLSSSLSSATWWTGESVRVRHGPEGTSKRDVGVIGGRSCTSSWRHT